MTSRLKTAPARLYASAATVPNSSVTVTTRTREIQAASLQPSRYRAKITAMLARPIFTPGIPTEGSRDSTYDRIMAAAASRAAVVITLVFMAQYTSTPEGVPSSIWITTRWGRQMMLSPL